MDQMTALKLVKSNKQSPIKDNPEIMNIFDEISWKHTTMLANDAMNKSEIFIASQHYKKAIQIAKNHYEIYQGNSNFTDGLVGVVIVSYLNIANLWDVHKKDKLKKKCLIEAFYFLIQAFNSSGTSINTRKHLCQEIAKVYMELSKCILTKKDLDILETYQRIIINL